MDILAYNRDAWDRQVANGNQWTRPVSSEEIARARRGDWQIVLTPQKPVPRDWFPPLEGARVLALASGGGQQGPLLAAAGAQVTVFDNSPAQLAQDRMVAERDGLAIATVQGDMRDLSCFEDASFDFIVHPCSNCFAPEIQPVWNEAYRVLRRGGTMIAGIVNPVVFALDPELSEQGVAQFKYRIPYSDLESLSEEERRRYTDPGEPLAFGHSLDDQIGGQIRAGFALTGFYEDSWDTEPEPIHRFMACYIATRAIKL
ncbi:class I SAM-dependent methyltransferase [bacterium]|nr:class I SAM-dependent methyltransferase [bacterium]